MRFHAAKSLSMITATVLAVGTALVLTAAPAHAEDGFELELNLPEMKDSDEYVGFTPTLTNSTGETVEDVEVEFTVSEPDGATPPVTIQQGDPDEGGEEPYPSCEGSDDRLSIRCGLTLQPGENKYPMYLFRDEEVDVGEHDTVAVRGEAVRGDDTVDSTEGRFTIEHDPALDRVKFDGVPDSVPTDKIRPNGVDWSFTITNDTQTDITDGFIVIELYAEDGHRGLELGTEQKGCEETHDEDEVTRCEGVPLAAGDSLTYDMRLYADGTTEDLSEKVSLTVRMSYPTDAEQVRFASGETHTKADAASSDEILPVTGFSLGGYLAVGAGVIGLGVVMLLLASRRAARQRV